MKIKICPHFVGQDETMFAIAEARANHNQNFDIQTYSVETLYSKEELVLPIKGTGW